MKKKNSGLLITGVLFGLGSGILTESLLISLPFMPGIVLPPLILMPTVIASVLGAWAGWPALIAATLSCAGAAFSTIGSIGALTILEASMLPAWGVQLILRRRPGFYQGVAQSAVLEIGALMVLLAGAWFTVRQDLIGYFMDYLQKYALSRPMEADIVLRAMNEIGLIGSNSGINSTGIISVADRTQMIGELFQRYTRDLQQSLPQIVICDGLMSGAISYWLAARIASRRGDEPPVSYAHPRDWYLTTHLVIGPVLCALLCYIGFRLDIQGMDAAYLVMFGLANLLFSIQGLASLDRLLTRSMTGSTARTVILAASALIAQTILPMLGIISALFGSRGLVTRWLMKRSQKNQKGGDKS